LRVALHRVLAPKFLSSTNANLCEHVNADAINLSLASASTKKSPTLLQPGAGMGGLFAAYDMDSLDSLPAKKESMMKVLGAAREVNKDQTGHLMSKIAGRIQSIEGKQVGMLGLAFKPNTNAVEGSPRPCASRKR